jgi:methanogenic corrinoid protein MtbC1
MVTACVADDLHEIGARILADFFEMDGWDTHYIGASTPADGVATMAAELGADVAALSVTMVEHIPQAEEAVAAIRAASPDTHIIVGGYPFLRDPSLAEAIGADATAHDAAHAVTVAAALVDSGPRA